MPYKTIQHLVICKNLITEGKTEYRLLQPLCPLEVNKFNAFIKPLKFSVLTGMKERALILLRFYTKYITLF
jgi:hypothetical protein